MTPGRRPFCLVALFALLLPAAIPRSTFAGQDRVRVVATLPNLGSIATAVGGDRVEVTTIATGTQDAHFVDPKPSYMVKLRNASLLLINGLDLEIGWVPPLTQGARTARLIQGGPGYIDCSTGIQVVEIPTSLSRAEGDVHPYGNPHYLTDPLNAETVAGTIAEALKRIDPASTQAYEDGRKAFVKQLHEAIFGKELVDLAGGAKLAREAAAGTLDPFLDGTSVGGAPLRSRLGGWLGKMQALRGKPVITYHKDYSYFANRFGIVVVDYVEPKPGIQPSAKHLEELTERLHQGVARVILTRPYVEHRSTDSLAERTGVKVVTLPLEVGGAPGATDYFRLFDYVTDQIVQAFATAAPAGGR
ncbi:MAG TPA: metal ABC transporter substrate-binding protein [Candidatus Polarisedimenticolia bacterium]|nr:metal ABC transporter substrate-binding protein [Candidatus Polarisedimenticolia bacterium]